MQEKISVRLPASGDLFVIDDLLKQLPESCITNDVGNSLRVELLTKRMMLIPTELIKSESEEDGRVAAAVAQQELAKVGVVCYEDEAAVRLVADEVAALVVVPKDLICLLEERYGESGVVYDVPLLRGPVIMGKHLFVDSSQGLTTVKLFGAADSEKIDSDRLLFADVYDSPTDASAIYWVQRVASVMKLNELTPLYIYRCSGTMRRLLQRNFKKIMVCE